MHQLQSHLRNTFLAGIFAVIPLAVTGFVIYKVDEWTRGISTALFGKPIPFVGLLVAVAVVYLAGLVATISVGRLVIRLVDNLLSRVPGLRMFYTAWKQVVLTPGGTEGVFSRVVLIPDETGAAHVIGFTCPRPIENDPNTYCVFVPAAPNPMNGRLYFVNKQKCAPVDLSTEEAFKVVLSTGNYVPGELGTALRKLVPVK